MPSKTHRPLLLLLAALTPCAAPLRAQEPARLDARAEAVAAGEVEEYLRLLQTAGVAPAYPWSIRSFSPAEVDRLSPDSAHPWRSARVAAGARGDGGGLLRPSVRTTYNSAFAYGANDGPVWAGRGATVEARAGFAARLGPLSLRLEPVVFWAENRAFALMPNGLDSQYVYADGRTPRLIDLPQRFGDAAYARVDPGESTLRLDLAGLTAGASTASQQWGPGADNPLILGSNAGGFPHLFLGTARPVNVGLGRAHMRLVWGRLEASEYTYASDSTARRFMAGAVGVFTPAFLEGLELGATRFFHLPWNGSGPDAADFLKPFEGITKVSVENTGNPAHALPDNQLASVFARLRLRRAAMEFYAEYAREDHSWDPLDLLMEPDHSGGYLLGFRKAWVRGPGAITQLRAEVVNTQVSHIIEAREQGPFYVHGATKTGHTVRGQVLGSPLAYGGGGSVVGLDRYHPAGRWTVEWTRARMGDRWNFWETGEAEPRSTEVMHTLAGEALFFRGAVDLAAGLAATANLNRHHASDAYNLNAYFSIRVGS